MRVLRQLRRVERVDSLILLVAEGISRLSFIAPSLRRGHQCQQCSARGKDRYQWARQLLLFLSVGSRLWELLESA